MKCAPKIAGKPDFPSLLESAVAAIVPQIQPWQIESDGLPDPRVVSKLADEHATRLFESHREALVGHLSALIAGQVRDAVQYRPDEEILSLPVSQIPGLDQYSCNALQSSGLKTLGNILDVGLCDLPQRRLGLKSLGEARVKEIFIEIFKLLPPLPPVQHACSGLSVQRLELSARSLLEKIEAASLFTVGDLLNMGADRLYVRPLISRAMIHEIALELERLSPGLADIFYRHSSLRPKR